MCTPSTPSSAGHGVGHPRTRRTWWRDEKVRAHLRCEGVALEFLVLGVGAALAGLHMAPVACIALAAAIAGCDIHGWIRENTDRSG